MNTRCEPVARPLARTGWPLARRHLPGLSRVEILENDRSLFTRQDPTMSDWRFPLVCAPAPAEKRQGHIDWHDPVLSGWSWPYIAIHGAHPGPAVLITAGVHGSEYSAIDAAIRLAAMLDPRDLHGQLLCLPLVNPPAFWQRAAYVCPVDNLNLNRVFPGKALGSFSERLAWHLGQHAIRHADALLDFHGGDIPEALVPFTIYERTGDIALDARSHALAVAFGQPAILAQAAGNGPIAGPTFTAAARMGVPAIIVEDGGLGLCDPAATDRLVAGAENALCHLGLLAGRARQMPSPRVYRSFVWIRSRHAGFFRPHVAVGDAVQAGTLLGTVGDFFGATLEAIASPVDGHILFLVVSAALSEAGLICGIGAGN